VGAGTALGEGAQHALRDDQRARRGSRPAARLPPPRRSVRQSLPNPGRRLVGVAATRASEPGETATAFLARRRALLLRGPPDLLELARRPESFRVARSSPAKRTSWSGPSTTACRPSSPTLRSGSPGCTPRSTAQPRAGARDPSAVDLHGSTVPSHHQLPTDERGGVGRMVAAPTSRPAGLGSLPGPTFEGGPGALLAPLPVLGNASSGRARPLRTRRARDRRGAPASHGPGDA
jgi:hypothetical protein